MMLSMETDAVAAPAMQSELLETLFSLVSSALVLFDDQGRILKVNGAFSELLGYPSVELLGKPLLDFLHTADRENLLSRHGWHLPDCLAGQSLELRYSNKSGRLLYGRSKLVVVGTGHDGVQHLLGEVVPIAAPQSPDKHLEQDQSPQRMADISECKRMERTLCESEGRLTLKTEERLALMDFAFSHGQEAAYLIDSQARIRFVNDEAYRVLGYSHEELFSMTLADIALDWSNEQALELWRTIHKRPAEIFETRHRTKDGRIFPVEVSATYVEIGGKGYALALTRDISDRKRMEAAQWESERRYREVFDSSSDCLYLLEVTADKRFRYIEINSAFEKSFGLPRAQLIGRYVGESSVAETSQKVLAQLAHCLELGCSIEWESELDLPAGLGTFILTFFPVRDEQGHIYRIAGINRDITERKQMETRLQTSEQQFRALAENSLNIIIRYDRDCRRIYVNPAFERETGLSPVQALQHGIEVGWSVMNMSACEYLTLLRQVIATGVQIETVLEWPRPESGEIAVHALQLIAELGADGEVVSVLAKGHNITALKRHERLEETRLRIFERLARGGPLSEVLALVTRYVEKARPDFLASIMLVDDDGRHLIAEPAPSLSAEYVAAIGRIEISEGAGICGTAAWRKATVIAEDLRTYPYFHEFRELAAKAGLLACWSEPILDSTGKVLGTFCIYLRQPGLPTADDLELARQASHLAAIAIERKRAETRLLESEQRYREIFDNSLDALFLLEADEDGIFRAIEVNPALEHSMGMDRAELVGKTIGEMLPPHVAARIIAKYRRFMASGIPIDGEVELDLSAERLTFHFTLIPVRGTCGHIQRIIGIVRDVTERKRAERILHTREQEFRTLIENSPDVIVRFNQEGQRIYCNPAYERLYGISVDEVVGTALTHKSYLPATLSARYHEGILEILRTGEPAAIETSWTKANGEQVIQHVRVVPEFDQYGQVISIITIARDISALKATERRLEESHGQLRKLSSHRETTREEERKRIAREIHDELGQQLTALRMGISLLRLQFGEDNPLLLERVRALMELTDETIQVVRNVATSLRPAALDMGLASALEWLVTEFSQHTGIPCRLEAPAARLALDDERATAAFRVIQESLTNVARHAQASQVDIRLERDTEDFLIEVRDNGKGCDPGHHLKGTLGLLGMRERGHMLGGEVAIDSAPGQGTCVRVRIPIQTGIKEP
jgi:PAS domain S-box-containing protein